MIGQATCTRLAKTCGLSLCACKFTAIKANLPFNRAACACCWRLRLDSPGNAVTLASMLAGRIRSSLLFDADDQPKPVLGCLCWVCWPVTGHGMAHATTDAGLSDWHALAFAASHRCIVSPFSVCVCGMLVSSVKLLTDISSSVAADGNSIMMFVQGCLHSRISLCFTWCLLFCSRSTSSCMKAIQVPLLLLMGCYHLSVSAFSLHIGCCISISV